MFIIFFNDTLNLGTLKKMKQCLGNYNLQACHKNDTSTLDKKTTKYDSINLKVQTSM